MPNGFFFSRSELATVKEPPSLVARCGICGIFKKCQSPKMPYSGEGRLGVLIVGEAPEVEDDRRGKHFIGEEGTVLRRTLKRIGIMPDRDCWFTNAAICKQPKAQVPTDKVIDYCRPNLLRTIDELNPKSIVLLGSKAVRSLLASAYKEDVGGIKRWAGWRIPCRKPNAWIHPTFHPSFVLREERVKEVLQRVFDQHVAAAFQNESRPWETVPDYSKSVLKVTDHNEAAKIVRGFTASKLLVAIDLETNMLKPDSDRARIVSCAVSEGNVSVSYPWTGEAIKATRELVISPDVRKIGANIKFEERWFRKHLGCRCVNWRWDTVVQAHVLDNRPGIASVKFQSFVRFGQGDYNSHLDSMLKSKTKGGSVENRITDIDLNSLLLYGGMDAILEFKIAELQAKELGVRLT